MSESPAAVLVDSTGNFIGVDNNPLVVTGEKIFTYKVLGQSVPTANVLTDIYTVPVNTQTIIKSITICNQTNDGVTFSISIAKDGESDDPKQYIYWDIFLNISDTFLTEMNIGIDAGDVVRIKTTDSPVSFNLFGVEIT